MGVFPIVCCVWPVASHSVGDFVPWGLELLLLLGLEARAHHAQAVANPGADLTVESPIRHRTDRLREALRDLIYVAQGA